MEKETPTPPPPLPNPLSHHNTTMNLPQHVDPQPNGADFCGEGTVKPKFGPFSRIGRDDWLIDKVNLRQTTSRGGLKKT